MPGMPAGFASGPPPGGSISPSQLASQAAYTVLGNNTAGTASPTAVEPSAWPATTSAAGFMSAADKTLIDAITSTSVTSPQFRASGNSGFLVEPSGNSLIGWDATNGIVASVDGNDRLRMRASDGVTLLIQPSGTPVFELNTTTGTIRFSVGSGSPESSITGNPGSFWFDRTNGRWYRKASGTGNTGWVLQDRCESGTYTPTGTVVTNLDSVTPQQGTYLRVGNMVYVAVLVDVDPTASGNIQFRLSLPIASAITASRQLVGTSVDSAAGRGFVGGDATNDAALCTSTNTGTTSYTSYITFGYEVL